MDSDEIKGEVYMKPEYDLAYLRTTTSGKGVSGEVSKLPVPVTTICM